MLSLVRNVFKNKDKETVPYKSMGFPCDEKCKNRREFYIFADGRIMWEILDTDRKDQLWDRHIQCSICKHFAGLDCRT